MIKFKNKPKFAKTLAFLNRAEDISPEKALHDAGKAGVSSLAAATPVLTSEASQSWGYGIKIKGRRYILSWTNHEMAGRVPLVILLQYGHATKDGRFLSGRDFINPAIKPVTNTFKDRIRQEILP